MSLIGAFEQLTTTETLNLYLLSLSLSSLLSVRATYREMRVSIIDMVLATDMSQHFEHLTKFHALMVSHLT